MSGNQLVDLPDLGDPVRVQWGLTSLYGRVLDSYVRGEHSYVLVEIAEGQISDGPTTVTVAPDAVEPDPGAESRWAQRHRFEHQLAASLARSAQSLDATVMANAATGGHDVDFLIRTADETVIVVEVKSSRRPVTSSSLKVGLRHLDRLLNSGSADAGLLIVDGPERENVRPVTRPDVEIVGWRGPNDDTVLVEALQRMLDRI